MDSYSQRIYEELKFLEKYSFNTHIDSNGNCISVSFHNDVCCITYHEYLQFGDSEIIVTNSLKDYQNYKFLRTYGLDWFVDNVLHKLKKINPKKNYTFLELVKFYIVNQLESNNMVWGIQINHNS